MERSSVACPIVTNANRRWPYHQYYLGEEDQEQRSGQGKNYWSSAESLESYSGNFIRDMMHGEGVYRWKYKGPEEVFVTYEGQFYGNHMHGYGVMSFSDGNIFNGIYYNNVRWGPGIESHTSLQEDVGLWRGNQLVRLAWRPQTHSVVLDLNFGPSAKTYVDSHRALLATRVKMIGEVNSAIELLKQNKAKPMTASEKWAKIYPKHCTDIASQLCQVAVFDKEYYKDNIFCLAEIDSLPARESKETRQGSEEEYPYSAIYYAWNNSAMMIDMMKHCFKHENQRHASGLNLSNILTGRRNQYRSAAKHEIDARTLIMASYLGYIIKVAQLVNECNVHPDVADCLGNTALMYATCGDRPDVVHFLVEAGASVNSFNDSCCTPLGVALMKFACESKGIAALGMAQAMVPVLPTVPTSLEEKPSDWHIQRDPNTQNASDQLTRTPSKTNKPNVLKKTKSSLSDEVKKKTMAVGSTTSKEQENANDDDTNDNVFSKEKRLYRYVNSEFQIKVNDLFCNPNAVNPPVPYLFEVSDMVQEVDASYVNEEDPKKKNNIEKLPKKSVSKVIKDTIKPSQDMMWKDSDRVDSVISAEFRAKLEKFNQNMPTILQLLADGADPCLVRCPQPALWIATVSGSSELVRHLFNHGADINEVNPETLYYTILDVAVSKPLTFENLELIRAILECGARTDHRLKCVKPANSGPNLPEVPGPTLLHAVLAKKTNDNSVEEEIRSQLIELLLEYNCSTVTQYKGSSALDLTMIKQLDLLEIFMKCPKTDLNAVINDKNQTVLVKMFCLQFCNSVPVVERLQTLTNLLLYGADPLLECQDGDNIYKNIFVYAKKNLIEFEANTAKPTSTATPKGAKPDPKGKNTNGKAKKDEKPKSTVKLGSDNLEDYKQALDLVKECARILHIRWIEAKLLKELIETVEKYQHRQWNMIVHEQKNKKACGLWLSCHRSLEIWDIFKKAKKKKINDRRIMKHVLCIVLFNFNRSRTTFKQPITADEKGSIENEVCQVLREHKIKDIMEAEHVDLARLYVTPELAVRSEKKFQVCFECALPFGEEKILCTLCKQVSFCSYDCIKTNVKCASGHPCGEYLKNKYFPGSGSKDSSLPSVF